MTAILNEKNEVTEKVIHIMITNKCNRNCPFCCNSQYDVNDIPYVTEDELRKAETIFLTGGEPFAYADPCMIASTLRDMYPNIKTIGVYTNAYELYEYLILREKPLWETDTLTISIKDNRDKLAFNKYLADFPSIVTRKHHRVYTFVGKEGIEQRSWFDIYERTWQKDFVAAPDSIFRRAKVFYEDINN